jgi:hypothetical protein
MLGSGVATRIFFLHVVDAAAVSESDVRLFLKLFYLPFYSLLTLYRILDSLPPVSPQRNFETCGFASLSISL